jgi:hypothetical protein
MKAARQSFRLTPCSSPRDHPCAGGNSRDAARKHLSITSVAWGGRPGASADRAPVVWGESPAKRIHVPAAPRFSWRRRAAPRRLTLMSIGSELHLVVEARTILEQEIVSPAFVSLRQIFGEQDVA